MDYSSNPFARDQAWRRNRRISQNFMTGQALRLKEKPSPVSLSPSAGLAATHRPGAEREESGEEISHWRIAH